MTISYLKTDTLHPLFHIYQGQPSPQPAYIEIDFEDNAIRADWNSDTSSTEARFYHHRSTAYTVSSALTTAEINDLMEKVKPLAEKLAAIYDTTWNGSNFVGIFTDRAAQMEIETQIIAICDTETTSQGAWDTADWLQWVTDRNTGKIDISTDTVFIRAEMTDSELSEIEKTLQADANAQEASIYNAYEFLEELRDHLNQ